MGTQHHAIRDSLTPITLEDGVWAKDYQIKYHAVRVAKYHCICWIWVKRTAADWNAKAWESSHILTIPKSEWNTNNDADLHFPLATASCPTTYIQVEHSTRKINIRVMDGNYAKGCWMSGSFMW